MTNKEIGERIKMLREKKGFNQNQLANKSGISPTYIYQLENGKKNITVQYLEYICDALEITVLEFFSYNTPIENDKIKQLTPEQYQLLNEFLKKL